MSQSDSQPTPLAMPKRRRPTSPPTTSLVGREIVLPADALVVRGGTMQMSDLLKSVEVATLKFKRPGISVYAADVVSRRDLLLQATVPHPQVRFSTMGMIREAGFEVEQTLKPPHHTIWLPENEDSQFWLARLERLFGPPVVRQHA